MKGNAFVKAGLLLLGLGLILPFVGIKLPSLSVYMTNEIQTVTVNYEEIYKDRIVTVPYDKTHIVVVGCADAKWVKGVIQPGNWELTFAKRYSKERDYTYWRFEDTSWFLSPGKYTITITSDTGKAFQKAFNVGEFKTHPQQSPLPPLPTPTAEEETITAKEEWQSLSPLRFANPLIVGGTILFVAGLIVPKKGS